MPKASLRSMWPAWNVVFSYGVMVIFLHYILNEGKCIQDLLQSAIQPGTRPRNNVRVFDRLMSLGKVSAALKILSEDTKGGVLSLYSQIPSGLDDNGDPLFKSVRDILAQKHPQG